MKTDEKKRLEKIISEEGIIDCHTHVGLAIDSYLSGSYPYGMSFEDLVIRMNVHGIDRSIVFPFFSSFYLADRLLPAGNPLLSTFPYEKENISLFREVYEVFPEYSDRAIPFAMFDPTHKTEEQVELLEKLNSQYPLFGLKTVLTYLKAFAVDFDKPHSPIKEFARKYDLPILFHCAWREEDQWANVFDILKIAENNPDLRICLAHSARFSAEALERAAQLPNCYVDTSALTIHCDIAQSDDPTVPSPDQRFLADYTSPAKVLEKMASTYPETILWGSDTPCHYFMQKVDFGNGYVEERKLKADFNAEISALKAIPESLIRKISNWNTLKFIFGESGV